MNFFWTLFDFAFAACPGVFSEPESDVDVDVDVWEYVSLLEVSEDVVSSDIDDVEVADELELAKDPVFI